MRYSVTFIEKDYNALIAQLFSDRKKERAAYILCRPSISDSETRLLANEILPVEEEEIIESSASHVKIPSKSFVRAMKIANDTKRCFIFVHSHPEAVPQHSQKDDEEEIDLFRTAYNRIATPGVHGSIVISSPQNPQGRIWLENGDIIPISVIRTVGNQFRFFGELREINEDANFFDRQIRAFGPGVQRILKTLTVGIVGLGGTGSAVAEQLIRLGVGRLLIADSQTFEKSNVNRVYGSRVTDDGTPKIEIIERLAEEIGLGTEVKSIDKNITFKSSIQEFRNCDVIFGCTDDEWGRSILTRFSVCYLIPVFDMGVRIDSKEGKIRSVEGRVTTLLPYEACLSCRGRIDASNVRIESLQELDPEEATKLRKEGYAPELADPAPAVVPFTTTIASAAVSELIHRLTGYLGVERVSNEVIYQFHESKVRTNYRISNQGCFCGDPHFVGRADSKPFLDMTWRPE